MVLGLLTGHTCGEACWWAKEDVCRCKCGGVNHGILKGADGVERPARTRRVERDWFVLEAVIPGHRDAMDYVNARYDEIGERRPASYAIKQQWHAAPKWAICSPTKAQLAKWPELASHKGWDTLQPGECLAMKRGLEPLLIWRKEDIYS